MSDFVLPDTLAFQLRGFGHPVHLVDSSGKKVGTFVPAIDLSEYEIVDPELSDEQLRAIENSNEWFSTEDVLRHLENLE